MASEPRALATAQGTRTQVVLYDEGPRPGLRRGCRETVRQDMALA
jgi:hypothetical protein